MHTPESQKARDRRAGVTTSFTPTSLSSFPGSKPSLPNWFKVQDSPSSPFCSARSTGLPSPTAGGRAPPSAAPPHSALCIFPPHQLFISLQTESGSLSLLPASLSFSFVISFLSGDANVFTRQCLHITVSCNYSQCPPTVLAYLAVKCLEKEQCGQKTQHRLRSSSVMLTSKKVKSPLWQVINN